MESSTRLPLATTSGSIASIETSNLGPSPALAAGLASPPSSSSLTPTPSHPSTILSPPSHSRRLSSTSSSSSTLAPPPAKSRTLTQLLAAPLRTVASSASSNSGASSTVYGARRSRAHGPAVLGQASSSSTKADESFEGKTAANTDWDEINLEMDIEAAGGSGSSRREEGLGRRDHHIEQRDSMSVAGEDIPLTDLKSPARPSFSQRVPSKKDVRPRGPSDPSVDGGSQSAIPKEEEAPTAGPSSRPDGTSTSQASPRLSLGHGKAYDYANASTTDLPEDEDEEEESLLYRGQAEDETMQHSDFTRAYAPPPDIYDDDDQGPQPSNREAPSSRRRRRLDFEALTGRERASYWITALLVLGLFIVGIAIGVDWIDWPGDGIGKD